MSRSEVKKRKTTVGKTTDSNEAEARRAVLEDLFFDFNRSRQQVYVMNFWRGIFFGAGSALGAALFITVLVWLLGRFADIFPALADFINHLLDTMQSRR